jgi:DNA-binding transcriptional MerR regulator
MDLPEGRRSFKINEVCKLANVQPYMLRYWATEFPQLEARKSGTGQRSYSRKQVKLILEIRRLLFDEGLTIAGARKRVNSLGDGPPKPKPESLAEVEEPPAETPEPAEAVEPEPVPVAAADIEAEVDKAVEERVQPLLAALQEARNELADILAAMRDDNQTEVGT